MMGAMFVLKMGALVGGLRRIANPIPTAESVCTHTTWFPTNRVNLNVLSCGNYGNFINRIMADVALKVTLISAGQNISGEYLAC